MKRFIFTILLCCGILYSLSAQASITRFAVVDMNRIISIFAESSPEVGAFIEKRNKVQAEIDRQSQELEELNARLKEAEEQGKRDQIRTLETQIRTKTQSLQAFIQSSFADLERDRNRLLNNSAFMNSIVAVVRAVAESEGVTMVLTKTEASGILWYSPSIDITNKVIERFRTGGRR